MANQKITPEEALAYHHDPRPGKFDITPSKPMTTQRDLSLAYSPGVAVPCEAIAATPETVYDYTNKGNMVAVISNGTAVLGLGNLGAAASKPVMEGKAVLFKRFADVNAVDIELCSEDPQEIIRAVKLMEPTFGGINLEDIKAPECFIIEQTLKEEMDIPVFHDDQHGTAVITAAGLLNALSISGKKIEDVKIVLNGAGAAGIACIELVKAMGARHENCVVCDTGGVIYQGREKGMNQWKSAHAIKTELRTLAEAMVGADVFLGVSVKGAVTPDMIRSMAPDPVIFAMANPDPEITPEEAHEVRSDAIVATGRSDYPNQVNNVLGFPYLFRGALDIQARAINDEMKIACAKALAKLARADVPDEVAVAYGKKLTFGRDYIIPTPFDPRLIYTIPPAVAKAGIDSGVARRPIIDMERYTANLKARLDPTYQIIRSLNAKARGAQATMIFAEGDDPHVLRAAVAYQRGGFGKAIVVGRDPDVKQKLEAAGLADAVAELEVMNAAKTEHLETYKAFLYERLQRQGHDQADVHRLAARDRHVFAALMLAHGHGDGMVTGATRKSTHVMDHINYVFDAKAEDGAVGVSALLHNGRIVLVADTLVHEWPSDEDLADIAERAAGVARSLGLEPRVAFASFSNFGYPVSERAEKMHHAPDILDARGVDFEYDGEMTADVALNPAVMARYPFCRLSGPANILVMPARHSASISVKMMQELAGATVIGPILAGVAKPIQLCSTNSTSNDILNMAVVAAAGGRMSVWNLGSINVDLFYRLPHLPEAGETLPASSHQTGLGGKGANQSVAIARAGAKVHHVGMIGADNTWVRDRLASYGVDTTHVGQVELATGHAIILVDEMGENSIVTFAGANYAQLVDRIEAALGTAQPGDILALQNEVSHIAEAAGIAKAKGMFVVYSAAPFKPAIAQKMLPHIDLLALNEIEAGQLAETLGCAVDEIPAANLLVTHGARGATWRERATGEVTRTGAFHVEPVDTSGAGDCFIGYLLAGLDQGLDRARAMRLAAAAAALQVTRPGTADAIPARDEVEAFLAEHDGPGV